MVYGDRSKEVRINASMALVINGNHRSLTAMRKAYRLEKDEDVKKVLADAIAQLEKSKGSDVDK